MRFLFVLALAVTGLTMTAVAQKHQKPKAKASYSEEKQSNKGGRSVKEPAAKSSSATELRRVEQSGARVSAPHKQATKAHPAPVLKAQKGDGNPPIRFASAGGSGKGGKSKGGDPYKGRLRHKGSRH